MEISNNPLQKKQTAERRNELSAVFFEKQEKIDYRRGDGVIYESAFTFEGFYDIIRVNKK